jgi:hypothetical protein
VRSESIGEKIAELEMRFREGRRNEITEKILQKNAAQQQKHLRLIGWIPFIRRFIELLRSYGKSILHKTHTLLKNSCNPTFKQGEKIRL